MLPQIPRKIKVHTKEKQEVKKEDPIIVQSYIPNPLLIHGYKFDFRLYVLVTSINPLRIYLYKDGMVRWVHSVKLLLPSPPPVVAYFFPHRKCKRNCFEQSLFREYKCKSSYFFDEISRYTIQYTEMLHLMLQIHHPKL